MAANRGFQLGRQTQDWRITANSRARTMDAEAIDQGLRSYMLRVYNYMALGVALTGVICLFLANNPELMFQIAAGPMVWVLFIGIIGLGMFAPRIMLTKSTFAAQACYWAYAGMWGLLISPMIFMFLQSPGGAADIARAFFITAGTFAGMSLFGYVTQRNLAPLASFLFMASLGLLLVLLLNVFFFESTGLQLLLSIGVVAVFSIMTAFETQQIKNMYLAQDAEDETTRKAIFGAFLLYGSFITIFIYVLQIMAILRGD